MNQIKEIVKKSLITYGYAALGGMIVGVVISLLMSLVIFIKG
jgi:hypothetical protein